VEEHAKLKKSEDGGLFDHGMPIFLEIEAALEGE
jgi:hypothetical protein